jgi:quinol monooxygenase YgiN
MIVVVGRVRTNAEKREDLIRIGQAVANASRAEPGCISYRLYEDSEIEHDFVFIEEWESEEALRRHFSTAHVKAFMSSMRAAITAPPDVKFHTIASSMDLADVGRGSGPT